MFEDLDKLQNELKVKYDFVIIGSGPAGITLALELSKNNKINILLLEGGNQTRNTFNQNNLYSGEDIGRYARNNQYDHLTYDRIRMFGGSSNLWGGQTRKFDIIDFKKRDWVNQSGWPISYNEMLDYYQRAIYYADIGKYSNPNYLPKQKNFSIFETMTFQHSNSTVFSQRFKKVIESKKNINFIYNANIYKLHYKSTSVSSIEIISPNRKKLTINSQNFIFAMGGIENARQLLLNLPETVKNKLPVGNYFQGHFSSFIGNFKYNKNLIYKFTDNNYDMIKNNENTNKKVMHSYMLRLNDIVQAKNETLNFAFMFYYGQAMIALKRLPLALKNFGYYKNRFRSDTMYVLKEIKKIFSYYSNSVIPLQIYYVMEQEPNYNSYVKLSNDEDYFGLKKTKINWSSSEMDLISFKRSLSLIQSQLKLSKKEIFEKNIDKYWNEAPLDTQSHHMGTTRMGNNLKYSVTDPNLKVHGIDNLYIAGSSTFPTSGVSNPTLTLIALSIRLSDFLKKNEKK